MAGMYALYLPYHIITSLESEEFSDAEIGLFIRGIVKYHTEKIEPKFEDRALRLLFANCKPDFDFNIEKYNAKIEGARTGGQSTSKAKQEAARENGKLGGRPSLNGKPNQTQLNPSNPTDIELESVIDIDIEPVVVSSNTTTTTNSLIKKYGLTDEHLAGINDSWLIEPYSFLDLVTERINEKYRDKPTNEQRTLFRKAVKDWYDLREEYPDWKLKKQTAEKKKLKAQEYENAKNKKPTRCICGSVELQEGYDNQLRCLKCFSICRFKNGSLKWEWEKPAA